jgi:DNA repair protein RecN (Recombination protein N)
LLSEGENSIESQLRTVGNRLQEIEMVYPKINELTERVKSAYIDMKDVREEASRSFETVEFDQERQEFIENRLSTIYGLIKKHSVITVEELINLKDEIGRQLANIESYDDQLSTLEKETSIKKHLMLEKGLILSKKRKLSSTKIEKQLIEKLSYLKMVNTRFVCDYKEKKTSDYTGIDDLQFLFSANKNSNLQPVSDIASGGEISRLMLCLKAMIAGAVALPAIIFDEIDTGTSGDVADRVGDIMKEMSNGMQVIVITHLPQIASKGDIHFKVYKEETDIEMTTNIKMLSSAERVEEIAGMLSGAEITNEALQNARVMLGV